MVVLHPELKEAGREYPLGPDFSKTLQQQFPRTDGKLEFEQWDVDPYTLKNYTDPILGGEWLAAIAPIGHTGYAVVAQTRAQVPSQYTASNVAVYLGMFSLGFLVIVAAAAFVTVRRPPNWRKSDFD
jgi:hypothetical protein